MNKNEILNAGLLLALEWGQNWLMPIQSRLAKIYPDLSPRELDEHNSTCQSVMKFSNRLILSSRTLKYSVASGDGLEIGKKEWETAVLQSYPWINTENLGHLFSQGMYYAMK